MFSSKLKTLTGLILVLSVAVLAQNFRYVSAGGEAKYPAKSNFLAFLISDSDTNSEKSIPEQDDIAPAATRTWDGGGTTNNWSESANWSGDTVPVAADTVIFDGTSTKNATIDVNVTVAVFNINAGYTGTISQGASNLTFNSNFTHADGTFSGGTGMIDVNGIFTLSGGTFFASSATTSFASDFFVNNSGSFVPNGGSVVFDSTNNTTFNVSPDGVVDFNNVEINKSSDAAGVSVTFNDTLRVNGNLTITNGRILRGTTSPGVPGQIEALGNVSIAPTFDGGEGRLFIGGNATRTVTIPAPLAMSELTVNAPNTTLNTSGTGTISFRKTDIQNIALMTNGAADFNFLSLGTAAPFTISGGIFNVGSGSVQINANFTQTGGNFNGSGSNIDVNGIFTLSGGTFIASSGTTSFAGNFIVNSPGSFLPNNGTVVFDSDFNTTFDLAPDGVLDLHNVELNKSIDAAGIAVTFNNTLRVNGNLTITNGRILRGSTEPGVPGKIEALGNVFIASTFDGGEGHLFIGGNATRTITLNAPLAMPDFSVESPNTTVNTSGAGTISFRRTVIRDVASFTNGSVDFNFLNVGGAFPFIMSGGTFYAGSGQIQINADFAQSGGSFNGSGSRIDVNGIFTLSGGTFRASSGTTSFASNFLFSSPGVFDANNGSVIFDGLSTSFDVTPNGVLDFNNVELNTSVLSIPTGDTLRVNGNLALTSGQLSSPGTGVLEALGGVSINSGYIGGNGNLLIGGNAARTITIPSPTALPNLTVNAPNADITASGSGIVDFNSRTKIQNVNSLTNNAAQFVFGSSDQYEQTGGAFNAGSGNITFGSLFTQSGGTFTGSSSTLQFGNVFTLSGGTFTASSGNTNFVQSLNVSGTGVFEHNNGTVRFISSTGTVDVNNSLDLNNVEIDKSSSFFPLGLATNDILRIRGNLLLTNGQLGAPFGSSRFEAFGDVTISPTFAGGSGNLHYVGTNNQTYTNNGGSNPSSIFRVDKPSGILTAATSIILPSNTGMVINSGTLYLASGSNLTAGGAATGVSILANGRLVSDSATTITLGGNLSNGGIVDLRGGGTCPAADTILIRSNNGTQRTWTGLGTYRLVNVDVQSMGGTGTKTVYSGTNSGGNDASWVFDGGCPTGLTLSPLTASVQTGGTQTFTASGGFTPYTFSFVTNNSGGSINPTSGLYTAGATAGVSDTIRVTDSFGDTTDATVNTFGAANRLSFTVQPTNTTAGQNIAAIQVAVQDQFGNTVTNSNASVTLSISNNPNSGTLSGTVTKNAVNGIATFNDLSINRAGSGYTLQAVSSGLNSATSNAFNINFGAAAQLTFTVQPSDSNPSATIAPPIQVAILDASGNVVTSANNPISIVIANNPSSGTLSGTLTKNPSNGIAVFDDLSINNSGSGYTLSATSGGLSGATSSAFNIANPFVITNTNDSGSGSLRQAILTANTTPGQQTITFNIPGTAPFVIAPLTDLPDITDSLIVDATTQPGFAGTPLVKLDGTNRTQNGVSFGIGFKITASSSKIRGFILTQFNKAIQIQASAVQIAGNHIGVFSAGQPDNSTGILIGPGTANINLIGGFSAADRNVISGNRVGIVISGGANFNNVVGNFMGTDASGTSAAPNEVAIGIDGNGNIIGGGSPETRNIISGNTVQTIGLSGNNNQINGNFIGTDVSGSLPIPNGGRTFVTGSDNIIGTTTSGSGNIIDNGIALSSARTGNFGKRNSIRGNTHINGGIRFGIGLTPNDVLDPDDGANELQNSPVLNPIVPLNGAIQVSGSLNSIPSKTYSIDFYKRSPQGKMEYLTSANVTTDAGGLAGFSVNIPQTTFVPNSSIFVTATDQTGNTSEFGQGRTIPEFAFRVDGTIRDAAGNALQDVVVKEETTGQTTITSSIGFYRFNSLPGGVDYTIRPTAIGRTFSPLTRTITNLNANQGGQDFTGTQTSFTIGGEVLSINSGVKFPLSDATVIITGTANLTATTDKGGRYSVTGLPSGGNYVVTISKDNFSFSPPSSAINNLTSNRTADFLGTTTLDGIGRVVFRSKDSKSILVMNADGTGRKVLHTTSFGTVSAPSFSADGRRIVFIRNESSNSGSVNIMNFDGSELNRLILVTSPVDPRFSPDGTKIIFGSRNRLLQVNADGSNLVTLFTSSNSTNILKPDWSPDGSKIAFSQSGNIFTINPNGTGLTQLTIPGSFSDLHPRFSPNGDKIAFIRKRRFELGRLFVMNSDGNLQTEVSPSRSYLTFSWSPDGTKFGMDSADFLPNPSTPYFQFNPVGPVLKAVANGVYDSDWKAIFAPSTPVGNNVQTTAGAVSVTFGNVSAAGQTTVVPIEFRLPPDVPVNFVLGNQAYEISTTATVTPPIQVCFTIQGSPTLTQFNNMRIRHLEGGVLVDRTSSRNFSIKQICASVSSLSPFVLAEEIDTNLPSISGLILDINGNPLSGVTVGLTGTEERQTQTNSDGTFSFVNLTPNGNYNVSPKQVGFLFNEYNTNFVDLTGEETVFFEGTLNNFSISGRIADNVGNGTAGVAVELSGSTELETATDSNGNFSFSGLPADGSFVITPRSQTITFAPESFAVDALTDNFAGIDFQSFAPTAANVSVSGQAVTASGSGIARAAVSITDSSGATRTVWTNQFGYFRFEDVEVGQSYIVSIRAKEFIFDNSPRFVVVNEDVSGIRFNGMEQ